MPSNQLYYGDNLDVLRRHLADASIDLVYLDPPKLEESVTMRAMSSPPSRCLDPQGPSRAVECALFAANAAELRAALDRSDPDSGARTTVATSKNDPESVDTRAVPA